LPAPVGSLRNREGETAKGSYEAFKYAPLEEIDNDLKPLLVEEEMDLSYSGEAGSAATV
jgi:hypothetical protein